MRLTRAVLLGVAAWLAVVAVGSTAVWLVISQAGADVGTTGSPLPAAATRTGPPASPSTSRPSHTSRPSARPTGRPSPTTSTPPPPPAAERRTWQGVGGYVTAECRGSDLALVAAQPDAGFAISVSDRGPDTLEVAFEGREDENGRHSEVRGVCVGGAPRFTAQPEAGGGGDG